MQLQIRPSNTHITANKSKNSCPSFGGKKTKKSASAERYQNFSTGYQKASIRVSEITKGFFSGMVKGLGLATATYFGIALACTEEIRNAVKTVAKKSMDGIKFIKNNIPKNILTAISAGICLATIGVSIHKANKIADQRIAKLSPRDRA